MGESGFAVNYTSFAQLSHRLALQHGIRRISCAQLEEDLGDDYRWSYRVTSVLFSGKSEFQEIDLVDTPTFGKVRG